MKVNTTWQQFISNDTCHYSVIGLKRSLSSWLGDTLWNLLDIMAFCESAAHHLPDRTAAHGVLPTAMDQYMSGCHTGTDCCPWLYEAPTQSDMESCSTGDKWPEVRTDEEELRLDWRSVRSFWLEVLWRGFAYSLAAKGKPCSVSLGCVTLSLISDSHSPHRGAHEEGSPRCPPAPKQSRLIRGIPGLANQRRLTSQAFKGATLTETSEGRWKCLVALR